MRIKILFLGLCCLTSPVRAQEDQTLDKNPPSKVVEVKRDEIPKVTKAKPMSFWMKHKLDFSKTILEALTMGDFEKLAITAEQMRLLGKIEGFVRRKNPTYRIQLQTFDLSMQELVRHAKRENPDGATIAFNQMAASCVACHTLLRTGID